MPDPTPLTIRAATASDLYRIDEIYNYYVETSVCTYQELLTTPEERREWFFSHGPAHPMRVAEVNGEIVAWSALNPFRARSAYRFTVENSIYVDHRYQRRGIGKAMLIEQINCARTLGHRTILGVIDAEQTASLALHARHGFIECARMKEVGFKFGRWLDAVVMQLML